MILVTGGAGFIGGNFVLDWLANPILGGVVNLDKLTYASNLATLKSINANEHYIFIKGDICDTELILSILKKYKIHAVINFAAESHVDRSIFAPENFIQTNILGTFYLLEAVKTYWRDLPESSKQSFRFLHVSTDEVYGSLLPLDAPFLETGPYNPSSPYSASKAASNHLVKAWHVTYGLPILVTNCSNNYGPYQFPEKLIPLVIQNSLANRPIPIYGDGQQIRDWLYVKDHCSAIRHVLRSGKPGDNYNIGAGNEYSNLNVVHLICSILDFLRPKRDGSSYASKIIHVKDRLGHDRRYAIDAGKLKRELGWSPAESFESGMQKTVQWYLDNPEWIAQSGRACCN